MRRLLPAAFLFLAAMTPAGAEERVPLGFGRLFSNDALGDGNDRWRTGAYTVSALRGRQAWDGTLPSAFGDVVEYRFRGEIIAPENLSNPDKGDRRYAGILSIGAHTHLSRGGFDIRLGADLVGVGPATGVASFQAAVHELLGIAEPDTANQLGNALYPTLSAEVGRDLPLAGGRLHPFVEARAGDETLLRAGFDLVFGSYGAGTLMLRDPGTGQRYVGAEGARQSGFSVILGADVAHVFDSVYLDSEGPTAAEDHRTRLRGGLHWRGNRADVFYGVTWLSEEFANQDEGQLLGSLKLNFQF
jgi:hypothetical protein